jgi:hypothetical protein
MATKAASRLCATLAALALATTATGGAAESLSQPAQAAGSGIGELDAQLKSVLGRRLLPPSSPPSQEPVRGCEADAPPAAVLALVDAEIGPWLQAHRRPGVAVKALRAIDVVVHVITSGGSGTVPTDAIDRQLAVLDAAYAEAGISFRRAAVTHRSNAAWFSMGRGSAAEREAKASLAWDSRFYLNFYVVGPGGGAQGWATFPWERLADPTLDGVVVRHDALPRDGDTYRRGDTAVHEVAHWLGLHSTEAWCMRRFSPAQVNRMTAMLATYRASL